jgi:hypothetical protein
MAEITLQSILANGVELLEGPAAAGDTAQVGNNKFLIVRNGSGASITVTLAVPGTDFTGTAVPDMVITIPAGKTRIIPLLTVYNDPTVNGGQVAISYSSTTTVTRSVVATY